MKARAYFTVATLLFAAVTVLVTIVYDFFADPKDPDATGAVFMVFAIPLFLLASVFAAVGFAKLKDERSKKHQEKLSINQTK